MERLPGDDQVHRPSGSVVASAVPSILRKLGYFASNRSAACRMSAFGSTPKTRFPFSRNGTDENPVPDPTSATTLPGVSPARARRWSSTAGGYPGRYFT